MWRTRRETTKSGSERWQRESNLRRPRNKVPGLDLITQRRERRPASSRLTPPHPVNFLSKPKGALRDFLCRRQEAKIVATRQQRRAKCFVRGVEEGTAGRRAMRTESELSKMSYFTSTTGSITLHLAGYSPLFTTFLQEVVAVVCFPPKLSDCFALGGRRRGRFRSVPDVGVNKVSVPFVTSQIVFRASRLVNRE